MLFCRTICAALVLGALAPADTLPPLASRGYGVIPAPQRVELSGPDTAFGPEWSLALEGVAKDDPAPALLREDLPARFGLRPPAEGGTRVRLVLRPGSVAPGAATSRERTAIAEQAYRLDIGAGEIAIVANAAPGLFYGAATLVQLLRPRAGRLYLPQGHIADWPDLQLRHIYWDDAHHLDRLPELQRAIRQAAFFKINGFVLKLEGHFQFRSAPLLVEPHALTPAEYQELTDYALRYHVQLIPYLDAPAHLAFLLKHPAYSRFRAFPESNYEMCIANPEAVQLLSDMYLELINANRGGNFVYLSTDEPYYVGLAENQQCHEKSAAAAKGGAGKLLAGFIAQLAGPLHEQGRTVLFWGEAPLTAGDVPLLPQYLVNAEVSGPGLDPAFRQHSIRQMIYTSAQAGTAQLFPDYYSLPNARRLHPVAASVDRIAEGFGKISYDPARTQSNLLGAVVAGWADMGLHPETFWLGYATITAAAWHPGTPRVAEAMSNFHRLFYGDGAVNMDRVYQLMSQQAHIWLDSWDAGPSTRKPIFGNSAGVFIQRQPGQDQVLALPRAPAVDLSPDGSWLPNNSRRLELASQALAENDELLGLLHQNLRSVTMNRYNLEVCLALAHLYRQNLELLLDIGRMCNLLAEAGAAAKERRVQDALATLDRTIEFAGQMRQARNVVFRDAVATYYKSWYPRVPEANGRKFLHELDDVKDHLPDRTIDMSYLIYRQAQLPFGQWVEGIRIARNRYAEAARIAPATAIFNWLDFSGYPVSGGIPDSPQ
jgi:hexosaminidase